MNERRNLWNSRQKELQKFLKDPPKYQQAIDLILHQHAMLHDSRMSGVSETTFDDDAWEGVTDTAARKIPAGEEHSIAWIVWHMARIEDITMNVLVADEQQVFLRDGWQEKLETEFTMIGNSMTAEERLALSNQVNIGALRDYRIAVGKQTEVVVKMLKPEEMGRLTPPDRLKRLLDERAVDEKFQGPLNYWGGLTVSGLMLMPPTRHLLMHLNEIMTLKKKVLRKC